MTCECTPCHECDGMGTVWYDFRGRYLGNHRCDDLDGLESCNECSGSGVSSVCFDCQEAEEAEREKEWEEKLKAD